MISVCIATYNGEKYIREQIESILKQLSCDDEIIVSDDGSCDETCNIIMSFKDNRIKLIHHNHTLQYFQCNSFYRASANFENALKHAQGNIVFLSDQDDIWDDHKVKKYLNILEKYDFVQGNYQYIDENSKKMNKVRFATSPFRGILYDLFMFPFHGTSMAFNRKVLDSALPFPKEIIQHDMYIGKLALLKYKCAFLEDPLTQYRLHGKNISKHGKKSENSLWHKIYMRLYLLLCAIIRVLDLDKRNSYNMKK